MDRKGDRPSKVPAGTFGPSVPPPPPPEAIAASRRPPPGFEPEPPPPAERKRFTRTLVDGAGAASRASLPPPVPDDARRSPSTLTGHVSAPPRIPSPVPPAAPMLSPPKWQGAKAYLEGREPKPRVSSVPNQPAIAGGNAHASAIPSKVTTKLGTPPAQAHGDEQDEAASSEPLSATALPVHAPQPLRADPLDDIPVEELSADEISELRASDPPLAAMQATPRAIAPSEFDVTSHRVAPEPVREAPVLPPLLVPPGSSSEELARPAARAEESPPARVPTPEPTPEPTPARTVREQKPTPNASPARAARSKSAEVTAAAASAAFASSLAPAVTPARSEVDHRFGALLLAAITLLSAGGWWLTRGGFQRGSRAVAAAAPAVVAAPVAPAAPTAPAAPPAPPAPPAEDAPPAAPAVSEPSSAPPAAVAAPLEPTEPPQSPTRGARPAVARRTTSTPPLEPPASVAVAPAAEPSAPTPAPSTNASPGTLPPTPSREDVVSALEPLRAAVQQCAGSLRGVAQLDVTVSSNGSVTHAVVAGDFAGTPEGSCIARVARSAKFSAFERPRFRVIYPYSL